MKRLVLFVIIAVLVLTVANADDSTEESLLPINRGLYIAGTDIKSGRYDFVLLDDTKDPNSVSDYARIRIFGGMEEYSEYKRLLREAKINEASNHVIYECSLWIKDSCCTLSLNDGCLMVIDGDFLLHIRPSTSPFQP